TNGYFGNITNVLVGPPSVGSAIPTASGPNWFTIMLPATTNAGTVSLIVQTSDNGDITLANAYTYNPQGEIVGSNMVFRWTAVGDALIPGRVVDKGANNTIYGIDCYNNNLYAGGSFTNVGGSNCYRVARFDGTNWNSMQAGVFRAANVNYVKGTPSGIYAGGYFTNIGGSYTAGGTMINDGAVNALAVGRFDGTNWNTMGHAPAVGYTGRVGLAFSPTINGYVNFVEPYTGTTVIAGGYFTNSDYRAAGLNYIAKYDGTGWTNMAQGFRNVTLAAVYDRDRDHLYVGGAFTNHYPTNTSVHMNFIARWNGTHWTNMAQGLGNRVTCMAVHPTSGELYVGGWFTNYINSDGQKYPANYVVKWDPVSQSFTNAGSGFNNWVYALKFDTNGTLYAGGSFSNTYITTEADKSAPPLAVTKIARWNGTHWTNTGGGFSDTVLSLTVNTNNNDLYASGFFRTAYQDDGSSTSAWYVARWGAESVISSGVEPSTGSWTGGYQVTISGANLGNGSDITNVTLAGVAVTNIASQSATQVVVWAGSGLPTPPVTETNISPAVGYGGNTSFDGANYNSSPATKQLTFLAGTNANYQMKGLVLGLWNAGLSQGSTCSFKIDLRNASDTKTNATVGTTLYASDTVIFQMPVASDVFTLELTSADIPHIAAYLMSGGQGYGLALYGANTNKMTLQRNTTAKNSYNTSGGFTALNSLTANVTFNGTYLISIICTDDTDPAGDVLVQSTSYGDTTKRDSFTILVPELSILGTNGAAIESSTSFQLANGLKFYPIQPGMAHTNIFSITNSGNEVLLISDWTTNGASADLFTLSGVPATVSAGGVSNFSVVYNPTAVGSHTAAVEFANSSSSSPFVFNVAGSCFAASTNIGPYAGGNMITITNGYFGNITNVLVGPPSVGSAIPTASGPN
ncbi:MAG: choice-of-anchor D domain-containing protein, partial [Spartobacteria bacterium]|nr:choice-of-anchor D domain-containing protein [Spartobacteria bacterium]